MPGFALDETKLHPAQFRPGIVSRTAIVERLVASAGCSVLAVVAPAGYGKTTLLAQWAEHKQPRVAWLSADDRDNDPAVLLTYLATALDRIEPLEPMVFRPTASPGTGVADVIRLAASIAAMHEPVALVLDNAEVITNPECRDMIAGLALRLPTGSQLAIGSRQQAPVPVSRLRAQGIVLELRAEHLAMDRAEAQLLLDAAGVELAEPDVNDLVERTEGWPAGLYLAALAMNAGSRHVDIAQRFTGGDRFMGDYLRSEFLDRVSRADVSFLVRTSVLERLSGPLCDVTVGATGSGRILDRLERSNLLVIPLDRRGEWYRYHHLFRDLLQAELQPARARDDPRAPHPSGCVVRGEPLARGGNRARATGRRRRSSRTSASLDIMNPVWASGRLETVLRWIEWFPTNTRIEEHPAIAVHGALIHALIGNAGDAERWATAAERTTFTGTLPDGNTMEGTLAYLHTLMCRNGIEAMSRDAESALQGLSPTSPYRSAMLHAQGAADLLAGELDSADLHFARAIEEATSAGTLPFLALLLTERGIIATEREAWAEADALAQQALSMMTDGQYDDYWTSALVYAWCAHVAARRGDPAQARDLASRAARLRPLLTHALPVVSAQALLELARAYITLAEPGGASAVLRQAKDLLQRRPDLGAVPKQVAELRSKLETLRGDMVGASALTAAELRLLPFLSTHLTFPEISDRLFISRHTVKSQAISVYRKLGVTSRGEAIARLQQLDLAPSL